jgi:hypothetical protein
MPALHVDDSGNTKIWVQFYPRQFLEEYSPCSATQLPDEDKYHIQILLSFSDTLSERLFVPEKNIS